MIDAWAIGKVAQQLGITAGLVRQLANELAIEPAIVLNGVTFFHRHDINRMRCRIAGEAAADETHETETPTNAP